MAKLYTVDRITERTTITLAGQPQKVYRINALSKSGFPFEVEIPKADFTKEKADQVLAERATLLEEVKAL
jgi:hypothetical protein